jgi:transcriptional regulator with XRE-family HTH domain
LCLFDTFLGIISVVESPSELVRSARLAAGLSQRALARRARTSQSAIARYESGSATPSWGTVQRLAAACGRRLEIGSTVMPDSHDIELAETLLDLTPAERLGALRRFARMRGIVHQR